MNAGIEGHRHESQRTDVAPAVISGTAVVARTTVVTGTSVVSTGVVSTSVISTSVDTGIVTRHCVAVTAVGWRISGAVPAGRDYQAQK
jgi:hypothetical protein